MMTNDITRQNSKCKLYEEKDKMVDHMIIGCYKVAQMEFKTIHD